MKKYVLPTSMYHNDNSIYLTPRRKHKSWKGYSVEDICKKAWACSAIKSGPLAEAIEVRKDLFLIEQMIVRSKQLHQLSKLYVKVSFYQIM